MNRQPSYLVDTLRMILTLLVSIAKNPSCAAEALETIRYKADVCIHLLEVDNR
jgi:hypothetical protein